MDLNDFNNFDDFLKFCREYVNSENNKNNTNDDSSEEDKECNDCKFGSKNAEASESARNACSDIPGGFQDINPQLFTIVTTILGTLVATNLPFNVQNAIGNWLELLGQSIITFNAQQQYFQGGPGRTYNPIYRNAANPFCPDGSDESQANISSNKRKNKNRETSNVEDTSNKEINELKDCINNLNNEIEELKKEIDKLKKRKV